MKRKNSNTASDKLLKSEVLPKKGKVGRPLSATSLNHYVDSKRFADLIKVFYKTGVIDNELAEMINKIANRLAYATNFINYCVDKDTLALTKRGWLRYDQINEQDIILSYDQNTKNLVWSKIKSIFRKEYNGLMHYLTLQGLDALVTPNHKFVTSKGLLPIEKIRSKDHLVLMGNPLINDTKIYDDNLVEIIGWAITEGHYLYGVRTNAISISQNKGPKADRIRNTLLKLNTNFKEYTQKKLSIFYITKNISNLIHKYAPNKIISMDFINNLTPQQRLLLINTMIDGDGETIKLKSNSKLSKRYTQKNKEHIDSFIALCTLSGLTTGTFYRKNIKTGFGITDYYKVHIYSTPKLTCPVEHINFHGGRSLRGGDLRSKNYKPKENIPTTPYNGPIWCPETEYGNFICRRNNYVYISGNTYREDMVGDAIIKMFAALKNKKFNIKKGSPFSYFTKIAFNAFCNRIKREKKTHATMLAYQEEVYNSLIEQGYLPSSNMIKHTPDDDSNIESYEN